MDNGMYEQGKSTRSAYYTDIEMLSLSIAPQKTNTQLATVECCRS